MGDYELYGKTTIGNKIFPHEAYQQFVKENVLYLGYIDRKCERSNFIFVPEKEITNLVEYQQENIKIETNKKESRVYVYIPITGILEDPKEQYKNSFHNYLKVYFKTDEELCDRKIYYKNKIFKPISVDEDVLTYIETNIMPDY